MPIGSCVSVCNTRKLASSPSANGACRTRKGRPGYLRVDTVQQGTHDGKPGGYHINAVDAVTQFEVVGCVEAISEHFIMPVLEAMLHQFPFQIRGFHCDNGSEFINHSVEAMLMLSII